MSALQTDRNPVHACLKLDTEWERSMHTLRAAWGRFGVLEFWIEISYKHSSPLFYFLMTL